MSYAYDVYRRHQQELEAFEHYMGQLKARVDELRGQYRRQLDAAAGGGFMTNYTDVLAGDKFATFSRHVDSMLELIELTNQECASQRDILALLEEDARREAQD
jgi:hypothetical protein